MYRQILHVILIRDFYSFYCCSGSASNYGNNFLIGFLPQFNYRYRTRYSGDYIGVSIFAPYDTNVTIFSNQPSETWNITVYIKEGEIFEYKLPISLRIDRSRYLQKGIEISSTRNISLFCLNRQGYAYADGYLALPSKMLGLTYVVASYQPYHPNYRANIVVISAHDNNSIHVIPNENAVIEYRGQRYDDGTPLLYIIQVLDRLDALYISGLSDLSGTVVVTSKPATVISSVDIAYRSGNYDYLETSLLPVSLWGHEYILTTTGTMKEKKGDTFRIFAYENNTAVETGYWTKVLSSGMYAELVVREDLASFAKCSKPCQVVQYTGHENGQPSMVIVPSVNEFLSYYNVILPFGSEFYDSITITIQNKHVEGLHMNGLKLSSVRWKTINGTNYVWTVVRLSDPSTVTIYHNSSEVKFGVVVYGWNNNHGSYAYPGGFAFGNHSNGRIFYFKLILLSMYFAQIVDTLAAHNCPILYTVDRKIINLKGARNDK